MQEENSKENDETDVLLVCFAATMIKINLELYFIGYPSDILNPEILDKEFQSLKIMENAYFQNNIKIRKFTMNKELARINKPVNKTRWDMSPPTVNAYYSPSR